MFWRILKKDLKRKKTMNIILLLFVIMCSMFAAASVNNIIAVTGGIDDYFERSGMPDAIMSVHDDTDVESELAKLDSVKRVQSCRYFTVFSSKDFTLNGKKMDNFINPAVFISDKEMCIRFFNDDNKEIKEVEKGCFYATSQFSNKVDLKVGDKVVINMNGTDYTLTYSGRFKGAHIDNDEAGSPFIIVNSNDFEELINMGDKLTDKGIYLYIDTDDTYALKDLLKKLDGKVYMSTKKELRNIYLYDMIAAYIMMIISIVLMFVAFVVLRFTIGFTISEEFREIGVMKAMGISNSMIRRLYIAKYVAISVVGAVMGFLLSIPLSSMMLDTVSKNMVLDGENSFIMGSLCSAGVVFMILLFCKFCTRRIKKLSPIDAVRSGQTGERFKKKSLMHMGRSKLPATGFLAANDVVSAPKQYLIITFVFTLCVLMMTLMANFAYTLKSEKIAWLFAIPETDAHIGDISVFKEGFESPDGYKNVLSDTERILAENGMPGKAYTTIGSVYRAQAGDKKIEMFYFVTKGISAESFRYEEGSAPRKPDEAALSGSAMKALGIGIGDRFTMIAAGKETEMIVTARISTFMGPDSARLCEDFEFPDKPTSSVGVNIRFDGDPGKAQIAANIEKLKEIYDSDKIFSTPDFVKFATSMSDTLNAIKKMMMILTVIVTAMIVILMERSFISKEKSEIALMKAIGISNRKIVLQHILRFVIVAVLACGIASAVVLPLSNRMLNWVFSMIGDVTGAKADFSPLEVFAVCPAILIGVTIISSFITAIYMRRIEAKDTASIE